MTLSIQGLKLIRWIDRASLSRKTIGLYSARWNASQWAHSPEQSLAAARRTDCHKADSHDDARSGKPMRRRLNLDCSVRKVPYRGVQSIIELYGKVILKIERYLPEAVPQASHRSSSQLRTGIELKIKIDVAHYRSPILLTEELSRAGIWFSAN
jgi:hypothetical protein